MAKKKRADGTDEPSSNLDLLASWRSHKVVQAGKIKAISAEKGVIAELEVQMADGNVTVVKPSEKLFARGNAEVGDYLVLYGDGYVSWSPALAFEEGYTLLGAGPDAAAAESAPSLGGAVRLLLERLEAQANVLAESETNHAVDWARAHAKAALDGLRQAHPAVVMLEQQLEVLEGQKADTRPVTLPGGDPRADGPKAVAGADVVLWPVRMW